MIFPCKHYASKKEAHSAMRKSTEPKIGKPGVVAIRYKCENNHNHTVGVYSNSKGN